MAKSYGSTQREDRFQTQNYILQYHITWTVVNHIHPKENPEILLHILPEVWFNTNISVYNTYYVQALC